MFRRVPPRRWLKMSCLILGIIIPFFYFSMDHKAWQTENRALMFIQNLIYPVQSTLHQLRTGTVDLWQSYIDLREVKKENLQLKARVRALEEKTILFNQKSQQLQEYKDILALQKNFTTTTMTAEVVRTQLSTPFHMIRTHTGAQQTAAIGDSVLTYQGVVGKVIRQGKRFVDIQTITDINSHIDAIVLRTQARGILSGTGHKFCRLNFQSKEDIKIGDEIVTSGLLNLFPKGLALGKVVKISFSPDKVTQNIVVQPSIHTPSLATVLILNRAAPTKVSQGPASEVIKQ